MKEMAYSMPREGLITGDEQGVPIWTIYDHPAEFPEEFVARLWIDDRPTQQFLTAATIEELRDKLPRGLTRMARPGSNDPNIVEAWL